MGAVDFAAVELVVDLGLVVDGVVVDVWDKAGIAKSVAANAAHRVVRVKDILRKPPLR